VSDAAAATQGWLGLSLDDAGGRATGPVVALYADAESGEPVWLVVEVGPVSRGLFGLRRRGAKAVVVPFRECAALPARAWTAQAFEAIRTAPTVDSTCPLLREHELAICAHYGIGEGAGRHAELAGRADGSVTARPA
jgi:hypothetical protein